MKKVENKSGLWGFAIVASMFCIMTLGIFGIDMLKHPIGLPCSTHVEDGFLKIQDRSAYLITFDGKPVTLAHPAKGGYFGPYQELKAIEPGAPIHAEFCASTLVRITKDGQEIYRLTQEYADAILTSERKGMFGIFIFSVAAALWAILKLRRKNHPANDMDQAI